MTQKKIKFLQRLRWWCCLWFYAGSPKTLHTGGSLEGAIQMLKKSLLFLVANRTGSWAVHVAAMAALCDVSRTCPLPFEDGPFIGVFYVLKMSFFAKKKLSQIFVTSRWAKKPNSSQNLVRIPNFQNLLTNLRLEVPSPRYEQLSDP